MKQKQQDGHLEALSPLERMIQQQVVERGIRDPRVLDALRSVPRERFFPGEIQSEAFADRAAPIGHGQSISQPYIVALMTQHLDVHPEHKVLELGTGSGYQTAILSRLAGGVYSVERLKPLLDEAFERVLSLGAKNVHFRHGDGTLGWPEQAPFDRILVAAGAPTLPTTLLQSQLKDGGIAVLPVGPQDEQMLVSVRKAGRELVSTDICPCRFVKLIGDEGWQSE
jgi:protein-L-isoaspartate(D-aspartate) O-methyltransferase